MGQGRWPGVRRQLGPPRGGPTWQSIMVSSSFNSIFFSPVSAHSSASRTGPSGRPPSFFRGASQSGDKARMGSNGEVVPGGVLKPSSSGNQALYFGKEAFPHSTGNKTQRCNHTHWEDCRDPGKDPARPSDPLRPTQKALPDPHYRWMQMERYRYLTIP